MHLHILAVRDRVRVCIRVCVCVYVCICVCLCVCVCAYVCLRVCICKSTIVWAHACVCTYEHASARTVTHFVAVLFVSAAAAGVSSWCVALNLCKLHISTLLQITCLYEISEHGFTYTQGTPCAKVW
jgi:hypothetical protein